MEEKKQPVGTDPELTMTMSLFHMFEELSRDVEDIVRTQIELLKMKSTMNEMKNALDWIDS